MLERHKWGKDAMMKQNMKKLRARIQKGVFAGAQFVGHRPGQRIKHLQYGTEPGQFLDLYLPKESNNDIQLIFIHGGAWRSGNKNEYVYLGSTMAAYGIACAVVGYRLYPEVRYPVFVEDVAHAIRWLHHEGGQYGFPEGPTFLMGHSAGAHIACLVALDERFQALADMALEKVAGIIGLSGVYRFHPETSELYSDIFRQAEPDFEMAKPINYVGEGKVPILMLHGEQDDIIGIGNAKQMMEAAKQRGQQAQLHSQPGYGHIRPIFDFVPFMPNHRKTMSILMEFLMNRNA